MRKFNSAVALILLSSVLLTGCNNNAAKKKELAAIPIVSSDEITITQMANKTDEELRGVVYNFVANNLTIDSQNFINPTEAELALIIDKIDSIVSALKGKDNNSCDDAMLNYLLWEFAKTQNEWDVSENGIEVLGIDPATRKVFVDVTFETSKDFLDVNADVDFERHKISIPASTIIRGDPYEEALKSKRREMYMDYLDAWYQYTHAGSTGNSFWGSSSESDPDKLKANVDDKLEKFQEVWGTVESVLLEQQEMSLIERLRYGIQNRDSKISTTRDKAGFTRVTGEKEGSVARSSILPDEALPFIQARGVGTYTYTGIEKQTLLDNSATMRFRFILDFDFNLGSAATMKTTSVYLMNYTRGTRIEGSDNPSWEDKVKSMPIMETSAASVDVVSPYIDRLINSYQKCMEESDYCGLYKLFGSQNVVDGFSGRILSSTSRYADWDKYYSDMNRYAYVDFDNYDYQIVGWDENTLQVLVDRSKKIRAKGSQMTMPTYEEKVLLTIVIDDDNVFLESETILQTTLVGEPLSMIKEVTGIADKIAYDSKSFTTANEVGVLEALQRFSKAQLTYSGDTTGVIDTNVIDVTSGNYNNILKLMTLDTYKYNEESKQEEVTKTRYATEKIMWLGTWASKSNTYCKVRVREYYKCDDGDYDTEAYVGLVNRNDTWVVVSYERVLNRQLKAQDISDKGCLTHDFLNAESKSDYVMPEVDAGIKSNTALVAEGGNNATVTNVHKYSLPVHEDTWTVNVESGANKGTATKTEDDKPAVEDKPTTESEGTTSTETPTDESATNEPIAGDTNTPTQPTDTTSDTQTTDTNTSNSGGISFDIGG